MLLSVYRRTPLAVRRLIAHPLYHLAQVGSAVATPLARRLAWAHFGIPQAREGAPTVSGVWVEVGANRGGTLSRAPRGFRVYAFEPNHGLLGDILKVRPDAHVIAAAVGETEGIRSLHVASYDAASSFLPVDTSRMEALPPEDRFVHVGELFVPTLRLDSFMAALGIERIDMLVSDTQGYDLSVLKSLGERIRDVARIEVEASIPGREQYVGADNQRDAVVSYLEQFGFRLTAEYPIAHGASVDLAFEQGDGSTSATTKFAAGQNSA